LFPKIKAPSIGHQAYGNNLELYGNNLRTTCLPFQVLLISAEAPASVPDGGLVLVRVSLQKVLF